MAFEFWTWALGRGQEHWPCWIGLTNATLKRSGDFQPWLSIHPAMHYSRPASFGTATAKKQEFQELGSSNARAIWSDPRKNRGLIWPRNRLHSISSLWLTVSTNSLLMREVQSLRALTCLWNSYRCLLLTARS